MGLKKFIKIGYWVSVNLLAVVGLVFIGMFVAIRLKLTNVPGEVDNLSYSFQQNADEQQVLGAKTEVDLTDLQQIESQINQLSDKKNQKIKYLCDLEALSYLAPKNVKEVIKIHQLNGSDWVASQMLFAVKTHINQVDEETKNCQQSFDSTKISEEIIQQRVWETNSQNIFAWPETKEWADVKESISKETEMIKQAAATAGIEPRLLVSNLMVEQLRLFFSQRELYKKFFEPLKILANANKISLGVMAIKEETAIEIENHLKDPSSPYYLGEKYEHLLDYPEGVDAAAERYKRLSSLNHSYNYLYGALYLKQFIVQWQKAGYDLTKRPEILATLFNVGFPQSKPSANPKMGGSTVNINDTKYSFGRLAYEFYYSGELTEVFPFTNNLK